MNGYVLGFLKLVAQTPGCNAGAGGSVISVEKVYICILVYIYIKPKSNYLTIDYILTIF